jgi:hypothetical protein
LRRFGLPERSSRATNDEQVLSMAESRGRSDVDDARTERVTGTPISQGAARHGREGGRAAYCVQRQCVDYLEAVKTRSVAWDKLREALGLAQDFAE